MNTVIAKSPLIDFNFGQKQLRVWIDEKGEPWFCAKDICTILRIIDHRSATRSLKTNWRRGVQTLHSLGGTQETTFINEPALYKLAFRSNKPEAETFTNWVVESVLPSINKTGTYSLTANSDLEALHLSTIALEKTVGQMVKLEKEQMNLRLEHNQIVFTVEDQGNRLRQLENKIDKRFDPEQDNQVVTPTQLGGVFEPKFSAQEINRRLVKKGFQWKVNGQWIATEKGKPFSTTIAKQLREGLIVHQLLWQRRIVESIR